jgi:glutamine---fructose-6-phosphate transaminase (isomerizing)
MNSISAMEEEIRSQVNYLSKLDLPGKIGLDDCLFIGAGDSYAAALIAVYASNHKIVCCNPTDIVVNPEIIKKNYYRRIYIVSVSGNTRSNILAAKISRRYKIHTTAITSAPNSRLARTCDNVIELKYKNAGIPTSGTASFMCSMLCCLSLVTKVDYIKHLGSIYTQSCKEASNFINTIPQRVSSYIFLGNGILFPISVYGTLKINEVLGLKSFAYQIEEFCHSPLFSIKMNDKIIIFRNNNKYDLLGSKEFCDRLTKLGLSTPFVVDCSKLSLTDRLLKSTFFVQVLVLKQALKKGLQDCFFLRNKSLLKLSSDLIY